MHRGIFCPCSPCLYVPSLQWSYQFLSFIMHLDLSVSTSSHWLLTYIFNYLMNISIGIPHHFPYTQHKSKTDLVILPITALPNFTISVWSIVILFSFTKTENQHWRIFPHSADITSHKVPSTLTFAFFIHLFTFILWILVQALNSSNQDNSSKHYD